MLCGNADAAAKLQYLHVTNGGMMAFYDDGNAKMCALRTDGAESQINE